MPRLSRSLDAVTDINPSPRNARSSEASFVTLASGRILMGYSCFARGGHDHDKAVIAACFSDDDGRTWSARARILVRDEGKANDMSVSFLRLQDGRIALFNGRKNSWLDCRPVVRFSSDECKTFSRPHLLTPVPSYYNMNNDRAIQLKSGRIIVPLSMHHPRTNVKELNGKRRSVVSFCSQGLILYLCSDDGGQSWFEAKNRLYDNNEEGFGLQEPGVVELSDNRVWSFCRNGMFATYDPRNRQWQTFSQDSGLTWSNIKPSRFHSPCSPMSVKRINATGDLLAVWNDHSPEHYVKAHRLSAQRTPLACAISSNDGKTWKRHQLLETSRRHGFCYVAIHSLEDAVLLAYSAGGADTENCLSRLRIRRMTIDRLCG